jgi:hypothetical protein
MRRGLMVAGSLPLVVLALSLGACTENTAPGNDREARLSPPEPPAEVASVEAALEGAGGGLYPEVMTDPDLGRVADRGTRCLFRFTRVGLPVFAYGTTGVIKLNGKLVPLPHTGEGQFAEGGVAVTVRSLDDDADVAEPFHAELVLWLPEKDHELGYHGFAECDTPAR